MIANSSMNDVRKVLIVENDAVLGKILKSALESEGLHVHHCTDSSNAFDHFSRSDYCALITDYRLPDMNGADIVRTLRPANPGTLMIGMSLEYKREKEFLEAGADAFLPKPFHIDALLSLLVQG